MFADDQSGSSDSSDSSFFCRGDIDPSFVGGSAPLPYIPNTANDSLYDLDSLQHLGYPPGYDFNGAHRPEVAEAVDRSIQRSYFVSHRPCNNYEAQAS